MDIRPSLGDDAVGKSFDSQNMKGIVVQQVIIVGFELATFDLLVFRNLHCTPVA